jgi:hypothetical protein
MRQRGILGWACLFAAASLGRSLHAQSPPNPNYVRQEDYPSYRDFKTVTPNFKCNSFEN